MKSRKPIPHSFVLDELESLSPYTRPMFGTVSIYVDDKIICSLREHEISPQDNGVWLAVSAEDHETLQEILPSMRSIAVFGGGPTGWQVIPSSSPSFEEEVLRACELVLARDPRIGKVPKSRLKKAARKESSPKKPSPRKASKTIQKKKKTKKRSKA